MHLSLNLPNSKAINLYPSLCLFEGTNVSVGRGTNLQFDLWEPNLNKKTNEFYFTPKKILDLNIRKMKTFYALERI